MEKSSVDQRQEHQERNSNKEVYIRTERGSMRAELVAKQGNYIILFITYTHDGVGVNTIMRVDKTSLTNGKPIKYATFIDGGKTYGSERTSTPLRAFGSWEKGKHVSVDDLVTRTELYESSKSLLENQATDEAEYARVLPEYSYHEEAAEYAHAYPQEAKYNFAVSPYIGWKVHLDVTPKNVQAVSEYLKKNGYSHKYLFGGVGTEGKAFTIYFGAKPMMDKWGQALSKDLAGLLCKPKSSDETEIAAGIVGRFVDEPQGRTKESQIAEFSKYGWYGMPIRIQYVRDKNHGKMDFASPLLNRKEAAIDAYERLSELYGSYFHG